jgi:transcriptional regulator with XRE-family HTH domain
MSTPAQEALAEFFSSDKHRSQRWMATVLGVSQSTVSLWMRGKSRPPTAHAVAISYLTGIPVESWLTDAERRIIAGLSVSGHRLLEQIAHERAERTRVDPRQVDMLPPTTDADVFLAKLQSGVEGVEVFGESQEEGK